MPESPFDPSAAAGEILPAVPEAGARIVRPAPTAAGRNALELAQAFARQATAPATLRAYKADWQHFSRWCAAKGFVPVPAEPATVGAYLASLAESHAPTTIRRRLAALGKMHRFNALPWNPAHRDSQEPLRGLLRQYGQAAQTAAPLTLALLRRLLATCDRSARGRRDRAMLLIGFAGALRRSELVTLQVQDVAITAEGLRIRIARSKTDPAGEGAEIGLPRGKHADTCPVQALLSWQAVARRKAGPLFLSNEPPSSGIPSQQRRDVVHVQIRQQEMRALGSQELHQPRDVTERPAAVQVHNPEPSRQLVRQLAASAVQHQRHFDSAAPELLGED